MKLKTMSIRNFGCLVNQLVVFGEKETIIEGRNGSGKSTIKNAFYWVLGLDAYIKARPIKQDGTPDYNLDPEVVLTIITGDGDEMELRRKTVSEKSPLGEIKETSIYTIDGFEEKKKDYLDKIKFNLGLDTVTFNFIIQPELFFTGTGADRRNNLLDLLCIHEADFLDKETANALHGHRIEEKIAAVKKEVKELEKRCSLIPAQIEEAGRGLPEVSETSEELGAQEKKLEREIEVEKAKGDKSGIAKLADIRNQIEILESEKTRKAESLESGIYYREKEIESAKERQRVCAEMVAQLMQERAETRSKYFEIKDGVFDKAKKRCPTCGHELPEALLKSYEEKYNEEKAAKLKDLLDKGTNLTARINKATTTLEKINADIAKAEQGLELFRSEENGIKEVEEKIAKLKESESSIDTTPEENKRLAELEEQIQKVRLKGAYRRLYDDKIARKTELEEALGEAQSEYSGKLKELADLTLVRRRVGEELEKAVNAKFKYVQWKLTEVLKSGEIDDVCIGLVNGINYAATLNSGAKINCLIDCFNVIVGKHEIPLWIDNAEQVTNWIPVEGNGQIIKLIAADKPIEIKGE